MSLEFFKSSLNIDFIGKRYIALGVSAVVIAYALAAIFLIPGGIKFGIDFSGGTKVQLRMTGAPHVDQIRAALKDAGLGETVIQTLGDDQVSVRLRAEAGKEEASADEVGRILKQRFGADKVTVELVEMVGPQVSGEMQRKGVLAVVYGLLGILVYVAVRFRFIFAVGAVFATLHDVLFVVAAFSLLGKELTLTIVAALLTIIGYSVNDTIVVFDRIRENIKKSPKDSIAVLINRSINQTLSRTILTALTVFIVAVCLFYLGGEVIHDFAFAMIIGVVVGCYSSIYIASPFLLLNRKLTGMAESAKGK